MEEALGAHLPPRMSLSPGVGINFSSRIVHTHATDLFNPCRAISSARSSLPPPVAGEASSAARDAHSRARADSSSDSADDAQHFLLDRDETHNLYSKATRDVRRFEYCLKATQAALSAIEAGPPLPGYC